VYCIVGTMKKQSRHHDDIKSIDHQGGGGVAVAASKRTRCDDTVVLAVQATSCSRVVVNQYQPRLERINNPRRLVIMMNDDIRLMLQMFSITVRHHG